MLTKLFTVRNLHESSRIWCTLALCAVFSTGFGILFAESLDHSYILMMRMASQRPVSIVGCMVSVFVPYFLSAFLVFNSKSRLVYLICCARWAHFACSCWAVSESFGSSTWLICRMLMFPDFFLIPMLIFLSACQLSGARSGKVLVICLMYIALIGIIYYFAVSPFLADLLDTYETMGWYATYVGLDWCL